MIGGIKNGKFRRTSWKYVWRFSGGWERDFMDFNCRIDFSGGMVCLYLSPVQHKVSYLHYDEGQGFGAGRSFTKDCEEGESYSLAFDEAKGGYPTSSRRGFSYHSGWKDELNSFLYGARRVHVCNGQFKGRRKVCEYGAYYIGGSQFLRSELRGVKEVGAQGLDSGGSAVNPLHCRVPDFSCVPCFLGEDGCSDSGAGWSDDRVGQGFEGCY